MNKLKKISYQSYKIVKIYYDCSFFIYSFTTKNKTITEVL